MADHYSPDVKETAARAIIEKRKRVVDVMLETGATRNAVVAWVRAFERKLDGAASASVNTPKPAPIMPASPPSPPAARPTLQPREYRNERLLVIPDLHCPFEHPDALAFLCAVRDRFGTTGVLSLGDEADFHAFSRWPMDPDGLSAGRELAAAIEHLNPFYREFPEMLVCESNHTVRPWKKIFESGLPAAFSPTYATILQAPERWFWKHTYIIDGVRYIHGEGRSGKYAHSQFMMAYKSSVVIGHIHSFGGVTTEGDHFAMNAGCLIDPAAYAFKYAKNMPVTVSLGCGVVIEGKEAHFIPMRLDQHGRWIGKLGI